MKLPKKDEKGRQYISHSQINKWEEENTKRKYIRQYFFGEKVDAGAYAAFGTKVGEALEKKDFSEFNRDETRFLKNIPRYDEFEKKLELNMGEYYVMCYLDSNTKPLKTKGVKRFLDYKTCDIPKKIDYYSSEEYNQLEIYSAALHQEFGHIPETVHVVLIGRKGNAFKGEPLSLNGELELVEREISIEKIEAVKEDIQKVAEEISACYKVFLKLNKII